MIARAATALGALSRRERLMLAALGGLVVVGLCWSLVWRPVAAARDAASAEVSRLDAALARVRASGPRDAVAAVARTRPVAVAVTETAGALGLTIARLEPEGERIAVSLTDAPFDVVIAWIDLLDGRHGLRLADLELERRPAPGVVAVRASFGR